MNIALHINSRYTCTILVLLVTCRLENYSVLVRNLDVDMWRK
jgi:hypothetical protein